MRDTPSVNQLQPNNDYNNVINYKVNFKKKKKEFKPRNAKNVDVCVRK